LTGLQGFLQSGPSHFLNFLRAESFFNLATEIERLDAEPAIAPPIIDSYGGRSLHEQSHGESFLTLFLERFDADGLYILDEPEAALSPSRQLAVLARMHQRVGKRSQFIIATHSPIIMAYPNALTYRLSEEGIDRVEYQETEHFVVTRRFLETLRACCGIFCQMMCRTIQNTSMRAQL
jgi:predicted ATPase